MTGAMTFQQARARVSIFERDSVAAGQVLWLECRSALGEWWNKFPWHYFVTLTFKHQPSREAAVRNFRRWIRRLEQQAKHRVEWVYLLERGPYGRWHFHAFVHSENRLAKSSLKSAWTLSWEEMPLEKLLVRPEKVWAIGRVDAQVYDRRRGASYYLSGKVNSDVVEWDFRLPALPDAFIETATA